MALLYCEIEVINFAICWNSSTLISTFNSKNLINYTQSAGNQNNKLSSSETTRKNYFNIDPEFLQWFIGFTEGDGAFLQNKNQPRFVLTQKEVEVLYLIKQTLGFGLVTTYSNGFSRYIVSNTDDIIKLINIFNGNLVLPHRIKQLSLWIHVLILKGSFLNLCIESSFSPSLNNGWLSGFTDAEGSFNVLFKNRKDVKLGKRVILRYIIDQKNAESLLKGISSLFNYGFVSIRTKTNGVYRFTINSFEGLKLVRDYFSKYPLKTKKLISYNLWLEVLDQVLNKQHYNKDVLNLIYQKSKTINKNIYLTCKTGSSLKF